LVANEQAATATMLGNLDMGVSSRLADSRPVTLLFDLMSAAIDIVGKPSLTGQSAEAKTIVEAATQSESGTVESTIPTRYCP
jgi:hypothetical protein